MFNFWDTASLIPKNTVSERIPCADYSHEFYYFTSFHTFLYAAQAAYAIVILLIFCGFRPRKNQI